MPDAALHDAVSWLLERQDPAGWWTAEMETNVTMTAEHVLLLRFLGLDHAEIGEGARRHILEKQRTDGSWSLYFDGPGDLSTTIEAYTALRLLGIDTSADPLARARRFILDQGGLAAARVFTKLWLALFGEYPWDGVPSMPPELVHLPASVPLNLYDFACWARGTIAPLLIVLSRKPVRPLGLSVAELVAPGSEPRMHRVPGSGVFWWLDKLQKLYERLPRQPGRTRARGAITDWIVDHQEADGSWGGIQPPWVYSLIALNLQGMGIDHPVMQRGLRGLHDRFAVSDDARMAAAGVHVPGVGHGMGGAGAAGRGRAARPSVDSQRRRLAARRADPERWRLAGAAADARVRGLVVRVRQRHLPRCRRHRHRGPGLARGRRGRAGEAGGREGSALGGGDALEQWRLGFIRS